jgi:hypothetical protein
MKPQREATVPLLILLLVILGTSGCVGAGLAAVGPVASVAGYLLDRGVDRTYAAGLPHVWEATIATLGKMQIPVEKAARDEEQGEIVASAGGMTISGELTKATGGMTKVSVTVSGGIRPDKETAKEILDRVAALLQDDPTELAVAREGVRARAGLASPGPVRLGARGAGPTGASAESAAGSQVAAIQKELEALRAELAAMRAFRAALVREFGGLRADMARRVASGAEPRREAAQFEHGSVLRVREMVVNEGDLPGSVLVVRASATGPAPDAEGASQVRRVDSAFSFSQASTPSRVAPLPSIARTLRAAETLSAVPSLLQPSADLAGEGSEPPLPQ